jgi:hypothetical protein
MNASSTRRPIGTPFYMSCFSILGPSLSISPPGFCCLPVLFLFLPSLFPHLPHLHVSSSISDPSSPFLFLEYHLLSIGIPNVLLLFFFFFFFFLLALRDHTDH